MQKWGISIVAVILGIATIACIPPEDEKAPASTAATSQRTGFTKVGSLEIQVLGAGRFNATQYNTFNDENFRIHVKVRKIKGDEYDFTLNEWTLVTSKGVGFDHSIFCVE